MGAGALLRRCARIWWRLVSLVWCVGAVVLRCLDGYMGALVLWAVWLPDSRVVLAALGLLNARQRANDRSSPRIRGQHGD